MLFFAPMIRGLQWINDCQMTITEANVHSIVFCPNVGNVVPLNWSLSDNNIIMASGYVDDIRTQIVVPFPNVNTIGSIITWSQPIDFDSVSVTYYPEAVNVGISIQKQKTIAIYNSLKPSH